MDSLAPKNALKHEVKTCVFIHGSNSMHEESWITIDGKQATLWYAMHTTFKISGRPLQLIAGRPLKTGDLLGVAKASLRGQLISLKNACLMPYLDLWLEETA